MYIKRRLEDRGDAKTVQILHFHGKHLVSLRPDTATAPSYIPISHNIKTTCLILCRIRLGSGEFGGQVDALTSLLCCVLVVD